MNDDADIPSNARPRAADALAEVQVPMNVIEEFRPLAECLEWRLGEAHWRQAGTLPFARNEVPFQVNNSGRLSENAAQLLLANCLETEPDDGPSVVVEFGAGTRSEFAHELHVLTAELRWDVLVLLPNVHLSGWSEDHKEESEDT